MSGLPAMSIMLFDVAGACAFWATGPVHKESNAGAIRRCGASAALVTACELAVGELRLPGGQR